MKATLALEQLGYNTEGGRRSWSDRLKIMNADNFHFLMEEETRTPHSWVAEIVGFDERYGLKRTFLHGMVDYTRAIGRGKRGVYRWYILESGHIYEVKRSTNWRGAHQRYFCTVDEEGDIVEMDRDEVDEQLNGRQGAGE